METSFWQQKWDRQEIGFHQKAGNPLLEKHVDALKLKPGSRVFVPLCGKSRDIHFLLSRGFAVAGAELSPLAVQQLFAELGVTPQVANAGALERYGAPGLDIFLGDLFDLNAAQLGPVDAIYDRAALVALPAQMRQRYAGQLLALSGGAAQLLISFEYDQALCAGPPFSVLPDEIRALYGRSHAIERLDAIEVPGGIKFVAPAQESVWLLQPAG